MLVDLTHEQTGELYKGPPKEALFHKGSVVVRPVSEVVAITLHQTSCIFGVSAAQVRASNGDRTLARNRRALGIPAHYTIFQDGCAVKAAPLLWYLYHGNALNSQSIGIEVEGAYHGSSNKDQMPEVQVHALRDAMGSICKEISDLGGRVRFIWAHRQSNKIKRADPGAEIWQKAVIEYAEPVLGLSVEPHMTKGGFPLPKEWGPYGYRY